MNPSTTMPAAALAALAIAVLPACQRDHGALEDRLERIEKKLAAIDGKLGAGARAGAAAAAPRRERPRPNPATTYAIPVDGAPIKGKQDALVTVVEAFEFACGYCEQSRGLVKEILAAYPDDVRVAYKNYVVHPEVATLPAQAACAANRQGKFAAMEELIWDKGFKKRDLGAENMRALAAEAGLDTAKFAADMESAECARRVQQDQAELAAIGVSGTPAFFVNGRPVRQRSMAELKRLIDEELARAKERVGKGTRPADYYQEWVVGKGARTL